VDIFKEKSDSFLLVYTRIEHISPLALGSTTQLWKLGLSEGMKLQDVTGN